MKLSPGINYIDRPIRLKHGEHLTGHGKSNSSICPSAGFVGDSLVVVDVEENQPDVHNRHVYISDLKLYGVDRSLNGITALGTGMLSVDRVEVHRCNTGIVLDRVSIITKIDDCKIHENQRGIVARDNANGLRILNSRVQASDYENIVIDGPDTFSVLISGCYIESSGLVERSPGVSIGQTGQVNCVVISGNGFEKNRCGDLGQIRVGNCSAVSKVAGGSIDGNSIIGDAGQALSRVGINLENVYSMTLMGNRIAAHATAAVILQEEARGCCWYGGHVDFMINQTPPSVRFVEHGKWQFKTQYI